MVLGVVGADVGADVVFVVLFVVLALKFSLSKMSWFLSMMSWFLSIIAAPVVTVEVTVVGDVCSDDGISFSLNESASKIIPP